MEGRADAYVPPYLFRLKIHHAIPFVHISETISNPGVKQ